MLIYLLFPSRWNKRSQIYFPEWNYQRELEKSRQNTLNNGFQATPWKTENKWDEPYKTASSYPLVSSKTMEQGEHSLVDLRMFPELMRAGWKSGGTKATRVLRTKDWGGKSFTEGSAKSPLQNPAHAHEEIPHGWAKASEQD